MPSGQPSEISRPDPSQGSPLPGRLLTYAPQARLPLSFHPVIFPWSGGEGGVLLGVQLKRSVLYAQGPTLVALQLPEASSPGLYGNPEKQALDPCLSLASYY